MQNSQFQILRRFVLVLFTMNLASLPAAQEPDSADAPKLVELLDQVMDVKLTDGTLVGKVTVPCNLLNGVASGVSIGR